ncbi:MAG: hypothetical protein MJA29_01185, partial [Candidatus Omnitrophica bacterium]|nr:hypothetical protein [Candidatus Omnitrophota bacterium]
METIDFYINENTEEATFDYYMDDGVYIKSITFKSVTFYNSWWTADFLPFTLNLKRLRIIKSNRGGDGSWTHKGGDSHDDLTKRFHLYRHFSLAEFCKLWNDYLKTAEIENVKFSCDESNYIILELTKDTDFSINWLGNRILGSDKDGKIVRMEFDVEPSNFLEIIKKWFGFKQESFKKKGKYYSTKPLTFYVTSLNLKSNLVNKKNTLYNNKPSDILCVIPVEDGDQIKYQRYEPKNCNKSVNKSTNHLKFEITDEKGKIVN